MYFLTLFQIPLWHNSYLFGAAISSEQLLFSLFSEQSLFCRNYFCQNSFFFRSKSSTEQAFLENRKFFTRAIFSEELFRIKIFQSRLFWTASLFQKSYILKKLIFQKINFRITYFFWRAALEQLLFQKTLPSIAATLNIVSTTTVCQKSYYLTATVPFHSYTSHLFVSN